MKRIPTVKLRTAAKTGLSKNGNQKMTKRYGRDVQNVATEIRHEGHLKVTT